MAHTPLILWSVDSLDWKTLNASSIQKIVKANAVPGSIVLMHDIHMPTAQALPDLLTYLKKAGYEFITVSQLLSLQEQEVTGTFLEKDHKHTAKRSGFFLSVLFYAPVLFDKTEGRRRPPRTPLLDAPSRIFHNTLPNPSGDRVF